MYWLSNERRVILCFIHLSLIVYLYIVLWYLLHSYSGKFILIYHTINHPASFFLSSFLEFPDVRCLLLFHPLFLWWNPHLYFLEQPLTVFNQKENDSEKFGRGIRIEALLVTHIIYPIW